MVVKDKKKKGKKHIVADNAMRRRFFHQCVWGGFLLGTKPQAMIHRLRSNNTKFRAFSDEQIELNRLSAEGTDNDPKKAAARRPFKQLVDSFAN